MTQKNEVRPAAAVLMFTLILLPFGLSAQNTTLGTRISQLEIGKSTLEDLVRVFSEPERYTTGAQTFTRDKLPRFYIAVYPDGLEFVMSEGRLREIRIGRPGYRFAGRIQVGASIAELNAALGAPIGVVKGPMPQDQDPRSGVLYEGGESRPGYYARPDLGVRFFLRDGKVAGIYLTPQRGGKLKELPRYDPASPDPFQMDLRGADLSALDLRGRAADLFQATFDTRTVWPPRDKLPEGFDPKRILALGSNPGLGVRSLHQRGITGQGVSIALVDNPLLATHIEYASRLRFHDYINAPKDGEPHFHGSVVVSLAAGTTLGVAPGADIYYVSSWAADREGLDFRPRAKAFEKFLELNRTLPPPKRIRVISMSFGWAPSNRGAAEMDAVAKKAKDEGILVITSNLEQVHGFRFHGLGREPLADPDLFESYLPGEFWARQFDSGAAGPPRLLAPMDSRTGAGPAANDEYVFFRRGGWSWVIPYIAGVYALAAQVDPTITPNRFWDTALKTGRTIQVRRNDKTLPLGPIIDPVSLIAALQKH